MKVRHRSQSITSRQRTDTKVGQLLIQSADVTADQLILPRTEFQPSPIAKLLMRGKIPKGTFTRRVNKKPGKFLPPPLLPSLRPHYLEVTSNSKSYKCDLPPYRPTMKAKIRREDVFKNCTQSPPRRMHKLNIVKCHNSLFIVVKRKLYNNWSADENQWRSTMQLISMTMVVRTFSIITMTNKSKSTKHGLSILSISLL